jgi:hypothetical protein
VTRPKFDPDARDECACWGDMTRGWCWCLCHGEVPDLHTSVARPASASTRVKRLMTAPANRVDIAAALGVVVGMLGMALAAILATVIGR